MKKFFYLISVIVFFVSCKKDPIITENKDLSFLTFSEEVLAQPITNNGEFRLLTKNKDGIFFTQIDTQGNVTYLLSVSSIVKTEKSTDYDKILLLPSSSKGAFIVYTFGQISGSDTISSVGIVKTDVSGNLLWAITDSIQSVGKYKMNFSSAFSTSDDGVNLIFNSNRQPELQNFIIQKKKIDKDGKIAEVFTSSPFEGSISKIIIPSNENIYILPATNTGPQGQTGLTKNIIILNKNAEIINTIPLSLPVQEIKTVEEIENNILITGLGFDEQGNIYTGAVLVDYNFNILVTKQFSGAFSYYSYIKILNQIYIIGSKSTQPSLESWSGIYEQKGNSGVVMAVDPGGTEGYQYNIVSEFSTIAISGIALNSSDVVFLAVRKSFDMYNDVILLKTKVY